MKRTIHFIILSTIGMMTYILLGASCLPKNTLTAEGYFIGKFIQTTVDHQFAKTLIEKPNDKSVHSFFNKYDAYELNTETLSQISKEYSNDVATFYFAQRLYNNSNNKFCQDLYYQSINQSEEELYNGLKDYHIVFIPGLGYKEDTTTGANFARQRRILDKFNLSNELIEIEEWGLSENNAQIIASKLKSINKKHKNIMLVSASKGGLETAIALGDILEPEEISSIKSWVSVGGILRGSPIADSYLKAPKCWIAEFMLWTKGKNIDIVKDISYNMRTSEFEKLKLPSHIKIIHYVGTPLATNISKEIKNRYCSMKDFGPNDGLTPIADEITKQGFVVTELGLDHYYRDDLIDKKTLALAYVAVKLERKTFEE